MHQGLATPSETASICPVTIAFWRDVLAGEWLIRAYESGHDNPSPCGFDPSRSQAVVRGEAITPEVEATGTVWVTLGRVAASSPIAIQAHACRVQARALNRLTVSIRSARGLWLAGAADVAATESEARRRCGRTVDRLKKVFDRELTAASMELRYDLLHGDPWPTGVLEELNGVDAPTGRRAIAAFGSRVPSASQLRALVVRLTCQRHH